jgi:hypothetical protein
MAIETAALVGGALDLLKKKKLEKAATGSKIYTAPKTAVGKLLGGLTGRSAAAQTSTQLIEMKASEQSVKTSQLSPKAEVNLAQQGVPVTGGISFGGEAAKKTYLPFVIVAGIVAIFYSMRRRKSRRRY